MSVINQMLRDLDQRQQNATTTTSPAASSVTPRATRLRQWGALLVMLMLGVSVWLLLGTSVMTSSGESAVAAEPEPLQQLIAEPRMTEHGAPENRASEHSTPVQNRDASSVVAPIALLPEDPQSSAESQPLAASVSDQLAADSEMEQANTVLSEPAVRLLTAPPDDEQEVALSSNSAITAVQSDTRQAEVEPALPPASSMRVDRVELTHQQQVSQLQQQALAAEQRGQAEQARQKWQQLIALEPAMPAPYLALAQAAQLRANEASVQYWLQLALQQTAESTEVHQQLAASYARQQLWAESLQQLAYINEMDLNLESRAIQATAWQQLGQHTEALQSFAWLAQQQPQQARWWLGMALSHDALGHAGQAVELYSRSLQLGGNLNPATVTYIQQRIQDLN